MPSRKYLEIKRKLVALTGIEPACLERWRSSGVLSRVFLVLAVTRDVRRGRHGAPTWSPGGHPEPMPSRKGCLPNATNCQLRMPVTSSSRENCRRTYSGGQNFQNANVTLFHASYEWRVFRPETRLGTIHTDAATTVHTPQPHGQPSAKTVMHISEIRSLLLPLAGPVLDHAEFRQHGKRIALHHQQAVSHDIKFRKGHGELRTVEQKRRLSRRELGACIDPHCHHPPAFQIEDLLTVARPYGQRAAAGRDN